MSGTDTARKLGVDKIALLGLFAVALLLAHLMVASRGVVKLSEPIELEHTGLSIPLPMGGGWQGRMRWTYEDNTYNLSSFFASASGGITTLVDCRYSLAAPRLSADEWFGQRASQTGAGITKTGRRYYSRADGELALDWAYLKQEQGKLLDVSIATAELPNGRRLDIEVHQFTGDTDLAENLFEKIIDNLQFQDNKLLEAGIDIIAGIKNTGLDDLLEQDTRDFFLIETPAKRAVGFTMELLVKSAGPALFKGTENFNIQAAGYYYIRGRFPHEHLALFQGTGDLERFTWKSEASDVTGAKGAQIILDETGIMTVSKSGTKTRQQKYKPGPAAIPDVLLEVVLAQTLESTYERIIVDIISSDGRIIPTLISRIQPEQTITQETDSYTFRLEFLDGRGFSQQVYLDDRQRISRALLRHEATYLLERASRDDVLRYFPERAEYILEKSNLLERNKLPR